eukprot:3827699-Pyramimonas_sp.AAC.1
MHYSEPGLDSIPYSAWAATSTGIQALADAMTWIMQGQSLFKSSNDTLQVRLPQCEEVGDSMASGCAQVQQYYDGLGSALAKRLTSWSWTSRPALTPTHLQLA